MIVGVVIMHIWALHRFGSNNPTGIDVKGPQDTIPFHPYYTVKDIFSFGVFFIIFAWFIFFSPNSLGHPDNYIPANPLVTPAHIVPEWYFLPFYAILRAVPDKLGGVLLMFAAIGILFALPWLDRCKLRSANYRPIYKKMFWIFLVNSLVLGWIGAKPAEGTYLLIGRIATAYYFLHFALLWWISPKEKTLPVPESIMDSVLDKQKKAEAH